MLERLIIELGPWSWWVLGFVLLAAEMIVPGFFLVWIGLAALVVGILSLLLWASSFWVWEVQLLIFALLAIAVTLLGRRFTMSHAETDEPFLNQRTESLVGRTSTLQEPIREGRGRIRLDDTYWPVMGPDLPAGTRVKVVTGKSGILSVEPA
ncbi:MULTISPECIES: NfeD family protein [unclassified Sinorhizobium]|uniref:NfeD family protein n=1 Tax=unclassified Sinorhizobium TaxID=2613772 RepID=UPI0035240361